MAETLDEFEASEADFRADHAAAVEEIEAKAFSSGQYGPNDSLLCLGRLSKNIEKIYYLVGERCI